MTFQAYLQWLYTGRVSYDDQHLTTYMSSEKLRASAFENAIMDTLMAATKKDLNPFPKAVQLKRRVCGQRFKDSKIWKMTIDLLIWEVEPTKRNGILGNFDAEFEEEVWKKYEEKKGDSAPYSDGLQSYFEDVWDYRPLNAAPEEIALRLEKLRFNRMAKFSIGTEQQLLNVHISRLRVCSEFLHSAASVSEAPEFPNIEPSAFQAFCQWQYFQLVPGKANGDTHLFTCYFFAET